MYDSFEIKELSKFNKNDYTKKKTNTYEDLNVNNYEDYFYDNQIIFKGITKIEKKFMYVSVSIRTFETAIAQSNQIALTELPFNKISSKSTYVNFESLQFLSIHPDITKQYTNLGVDLNKKFYGKTQYKTFIQLTLIDFSSSSNWYDFSYISWEVFLSFCDIFQKDKNYKNFNNKNISMWNISSNHVLDPLIGTFLLFFIKKFCKIENGNFSFNIEFNKNEVYNTIFYKIYERFDYYMQHNIMNNLSFNQNTLFLPYYYKHYYENYLKSIHEKYYQMYFKKEKFYKEEKVIIQEGDSNQNKVKQIKQKTEDIKPISFSTVLKINKNYYNVLFKLIYRKIQLTNDEENIKNFLIPKNKIIELVIQFRPVLKNEILHLVIKNEKYINNIIACYENNNEQILKSYLVSLFHIVRDTYGDKVVLDLNYNKYYFKSQTKTNKSYNLLQRISIMLRNQSNERLKNIIDGIKYVKCIKQFFRNKDKEKLLFTFEIFKQIQVLKIDYKQTLSVSQSGTNLYKQMFGSLKMSKAEKTIKEKFNENLNYSYQNIESFFYFIDIYNPKGASHVQFFLSSRDLSIILKKIKNKNIHNKYLVNVDALLRLVPRKISIRNEEGGKKVVLNFTKYKHLRLDWREQLKQQKKDKNKEIDKSKLNEKNKKFELKIYLKASFLNISLKDTLYDISTNELKLIIKTVKIYTINNNKYSSIVSIYYHKILEYWSLIIFFPHNSRKFITVLEPREVIKIVQSENLMNMNVLDDNKISEKEVWKYVIQVSRISSNVEGNAYFEVFTTKLLLKEFLYNGFEIISDGYNEELNRIIYIEITLKTKNLFLLEPIEKIITKVELDMTHIIFQSFSFHDLSWHKENFKLEDFEPFFKEHIISDKNVVKVKELSQMEEISMQIVNNASHNKSTQFVPKIVEKSKIEVRKFFPFAILRKLAIPIIKPYVSSQQHMFEKQMKSIENKGLDDGSLSKLIESIKYDRAHRKAISSIYKQKLENQILFQRIYSEFISYNPPIMASVGLNLVKENAIITLYYPYQTNSYDLTIDFDTIRELFFPYLSDILIIDKQELGKRIMRKYEDFIRKSPHFLKLFKK